MDELGIESTIRYVKVVRIQWTGHIMRRTQTEMERRGTQWGQDVVLNQERCRAEY